MPAIPPAIVAAARASQAAWRVPASVSVAQWALESDWGARQPGNNPFGIKAQTGQAFVEVPTHEFLHGRYLACVARFRSFTSIDAAFDAHGELLATHPAYSEAMTHCDDANAFADALQGVYATDPDYAQKLRTIMTSHGLYALDVPAAPPAPPPAAESDADRLMDAELAVLNAG